MDDKRQGTQRYGSNCPRRPPCEKTGQKPVKSFERHSVNTGVHARKLSFVVAAVNVKCLIRAEIPTDRQSIA